MINFEIDTTDIEDFKIENNSNELDTIKKLAGDILDKGGKVIIKRSYVNAPDDFINGFSSKVKFEAWWDSIIH